VTVRRMLGAEGSFGQEDLGLSADFAPTSSRAWQLRRDLRSLHGPSGKSFTLDRGLNNLWTNAPDLRAAVR